MRKVVLAALVAALGFGGSANADVLKPDKIIVKSLIVGEVDSDVGVGDVEIAGDVTITGTLATTGALTFDGSLTAVSGDHLVLNTTSDDRQVRINSRNFTQATGDSIAFQSKPNQTVATTGSVYGGQVSPRCADTIACANLIGLEISPILKGTSGAVSGDWRAADLILEDEGAGRTITGDAEFIRARPNLASTVTGDVMFAELLTAEGATNWELFASFPAVSSVFVAPGNTTALSNQGYVKVKIGGTAYRIPVLEDE